MGYDLSAFQLVITMVCAAGLVPRSNGQPRCPYAKIFLLPDRSEKSKRRTKSLANTNDPRWNQIFVYSGIKRNELKQKMLEVSGFSVSFIIFLLIFLILIVIIQVTVWDFNRHGPNDFLGETLLDISSMPLNDEPEWYYLTTHEEIVPTHVLF